MSEYTDRAWAAKLAAMRAAPEPKAQYRDPDFCMGSGDLEELSLQDARNEVVRCHVCGRNLKARVVWDRSGMNEPSAYVPRHKDPALSDD